MNKYIILFFVVLFASAKGDSLFVNPSVYYTYGNYNNSTTSNAVTIYNTLQVTNKIFVTGAFDNITLKNNLWDYDQQMLVLSAIDYEFPFYLKFNYAHIRGEYQDKAITLNYNDYTNVFNADVSYFTNWWYLGLSLVHLNTTGYKDDRKTQFTLRIDKTISPEIFVSFKPNYSSLLDGRELFSAAFRVNYLLHPNLLLKAGGFLGERAYYFDSDLLTIYNQDAKQYNQLFIQADYNITPKLKIAAQYQRTTFAPFTINYIIGGISYYFWL